MADIFRIAISVCSCLVLGLVIALAIVDRGRGVSPDRWVARTCLAAYAAAIMCVALVRLGEPFIWPLWLVLFSDLLGVASMGWALVKNPRDRAVHDSPRPK